VSLLSRLRGLVQGLTRHVQVKLVLLLLAAVCWFFVHTSQEMEIEFDIPLVLSLDLPKRSTLVTLPPDHVQVLLRGRGRNLLVFALFGEGSCRVDGGRGGESVPLTSKHLELQGAVDLSVAGIFPAVLPLEVDRLETRRLPVRLVGDVDAAEGWVVTETRFTPEQVKVTGPRSVLDTLETVPTEVLDLGGRRRDARETVALTPPWPTLELDPATVELELLVDRRAERRFTGVPLEVRNLPAPLTVRPRSLSLTVVGGEKALAALDKDRIQAVLDYRRLDPGQEEAPARITLPAGFSWTDADPPRVRIQGRRPRPAGAPAAGFDSLDPATTVPPAP